MANTGVSISIGKKGEDVNPNLNYDKKEWKDQNFGQTKPVSDLVPTDGKSNSQIISELKVKNQI